MRVVVCQVYSTHPRIVLLISLLSDSVEIVNVLLQFLVEILQVGLLYIGSVRDRASLVLLN